MTLSGFVCVHKEPVRKARSRIPRGSQYRKLMALGKKYTPLVSLDLFKGIQAFKKRVSRQALYDVWKKKHFQDIMHTIPWDKLPEDIAPATDNLHKSMFEAGAFTIGALPPPVETSLRWDMTNPSIQRYINTTSANLVKNVEESTRDTIRDAVVRSFNQVLTPRQIANQLHGSIGLFPRWEKAVENYRAGLMSKGTLSEERVEDMADAYRERLLRARARMIARTETRRATNHGQLSVWREAHARGLISGKARRVWMVDGNPCDICEPMDGEETGLYDSWVLPDGSSCEAAGDAHPNCWCTESIELD